MPSIPKVQECAQLACRNNRARYSSFCQDHGGSDTKTFRPANQERKDFNEKYSSGFWRSTRMAQLSAHPLCAGCLAIGKIEQAIAVDHVFPWRRLNEQAFYHNLFQSLCHKCHASKTSLEQKGIYRRYGTPSRDYRTEDYFRVLEHDRASSAE
jgi:5-methylcytosine-specific restriction protein A